MNTLRYYIASMRLRTLPLSVAGIMMGGMLAASRGYWSTGSFVWAMLTALSLQILSNIANELGDLQKGTDNAQRLGPIRSVQSGKLSAENLKGMLVAFVFISIVCGLFLILQSFHSLFTLSSLIMMALGVLAITAAIKYTFGVKSYGYVGLGDLFVFLFFGLVSVMGVYFLMAKSLPYAAFLPASSIGLLSTAMLNQNNMRDIDNDTNFKKRTMAVRMGLNRSKKYHFSLILTAFLLMTAYCLLLKVSIEGYLYLLSFPLFVWHLMYVMKNDGKSLDKHMKVIAAGTMLFAVLGGAGLIIAY